MQTARIVHTTVDGRDQLFQTEETLLNKTNLDAIYAVIEPNISLFIDDLAIAYTVVTPDFEESGRQFWRVETLIGKFESSELTELLSPNEKQALLNRANEKLNIINRMQNYIQNNGVVLCNPLPEVKI
jgi:hypothetical protein